MVRSMQRFVITLLSLLSLFSRGALCAQTEEEGIHDSTHLTSTERFSIHSNPWINLHHFIYQWARSEAERTEDDTRRPIRVSTTRSFIAA